MWSRGESNRGQTSRIQESPVADGRPYYVTVSQNVEPPKFIFRSPKDPRKWVELGIYTGMRLRSVFGGASDCTGGTGSFDFKPGVKIGTEAKMQPGMFRIVLTVVEAETQADPDRIQPLVGQVFGKLVLRIGCTERAGLP